eukprot:6364730-Prorocentrum_lima.AAC.1
MLRLADATAGCNGAYSKGGAMQLDARRIPHVTHAMHSYTPGGLYRIPAPRRSTPRFEFPPLPPGA